MGFWGGAAGGAATGAAIGSFIPGVGTALGAGFGGLAGLVLGGHGGSLDDKDSKQKKWSELSWFDKAALKVDEVVSSIGHAITGDDSLTDAEKYEKRAKKLDEGPSADSVTSLQTEGQIYGSDTEGKEPQGQQGGEQTLSDRILGRPSAINQEASLDDVNFNNNNFSF